LRIVLKNWANKYPTICLHGERRWDEAKESLNINGICNEISLNLTLILWQYLLAFGGCHLQT
jgi:hypothetical protein